MVSFETLVLSLEGLALGGGVVSFSVKRAMLLGAFVTLRLSPVFGLRFLGDRRRLLLRVLSSIELCFLDAFHERDDVLHGAVQWVESLSIISSSERC